MKLYEIAPDIAPPKLYSRFTDAQLQAAYNVIKDREFDYKELQNLAPGLADTPEYGRNRGSAMFALTRLHILVHGIVPYGVTPDSAKKMFSPSRPMVDFARRVLGIDTQDSINHAITDFNNRPAPEQKKLSWKDADAARVKYWATNKPSLPLNIGKYRKEITADIHAGLTPAEATNRYA
mgnify:CR=1 FL=1